MDIDQILLAHGNKNQSSSADSTSPSPITQLMATSAKKQITLNWVNPSSTNFVGVRIQRSTVSFPSSPTDGETVFNGGGMSFIDKNVSEGTKYYYSAFPFSSSLNFNLDPSQRTSATSATVYTVIIDTSNSNPMTSVSYADDSVGMGAGSNSWDSLFPFSEIKPLMFKDGAVNYYLNPNNFAQKLDGTAADITTGADGNVMIQFPKIYSYIRRVGALIYVSLSKDKVNENFKCTAHTKGGIEKDFLYIGSYVGNITNSKLNSLSEVEATIKITIPQGRTNAQNNGQGYQLFSFYQLIMLQTLYLIKYKNLNSQATIGKGFLAYDGYLKSGTLNALGMIVGDTSLNIHNVKLFGLEGLWGNNYHIIDGFATDDSLNIYTANENFNNTRTGYTNHGITALPALDYLFITDVLATTELGFLPLAANGGSSTTYFTDGYYSERNAIALITIGVWENDVAGIFGVDMADGTDPYGVYSYRLAYL